MLYAYAYGMAHAKSLTTERMTISISQPASATVCHLQHTELFQAQYHTMHQKLLYYRKRQNHCNTYSKAAALPSMLGARGTSNLVNGSCLSALPLAGAAAAAGWLAAI
jgi:hypothetical protein